MNVLRCVDCHEQTPHAYRLCDPCRAVRTVASRAQQGLPPTVESVYALDRVIDVMDAADEMAVAS